MSLENIIHSEIDKDKYAVITYTELKKIEETNV